MRRHAKTSLQFLLWLTLFDPISFILIVMGWVAKKLTRDSFSELAREDNKDAIKIPVRHNFSGDLKSSLGCLLDDHLDPGDDLLEPPNGLLKRLDGATKGSSQAQKSDENRSDVLPNQDCIGKFETDSDSLSLPDDFSTLSVDIEESEDELPPLSDEEDLPSPTESEIIRNIWTTTAKCKTFEPLHLCLRCIQAGHTMKDCPLAKDMSNYPLSLQQLLMEQTAEEDDALEQNLCQRCEGISLLRAFDTSLSYSYKDINHSSSSYRRYDNCGGYYSLGPAESVIYRRNCPLCRSLFAITPRNPPADKALVIVPALTLHRFERDLEVLWSIKSEYARCLYVGIMPAEPSFSNHLTLPGESLDALCAVNNCIGDKKTLGGRKVDARKLDVGVINGWIARCHRLHKSTCRPKFFKDLFGIRLVDVRTRKVVRFSRNEHREYLALSYVWGDVSQSSVAIGVTLGKLPATIEDAISVVRRLGKRYLWVDSLCIDQGDNAHKLAQIAAMGSIYRGAWATIVSLYGESANSGLPRVSPSVQVFPQVVLNLDGRQIVSTMPTLAQQIERSSWGTRAWTFQEALLSPRCIYFTQHQIYFECNVMQCCESLDDSDSPVHLRTDKQRKEKCSNPIANLGVGLYRNPTIRLPYLYEESFSCRPRLQRYAQLLTTYATRQMSNDSDALNAFSGILENLAQVEYTEAGFYFGIPVSDFPHALCWNLKGKARRRWEFPSWSWAGWEGPLDCGSLSTLYVEEWIQPLLHIWKVEMGSLVKIYSHVHDLTKEGLDYMVTGDPITELISATCNDSDFNILEYPGAEASGLLFVEGVTIQLILPEMPRDSTGRLDLASSCYELYLSLGYHTCILSWHNDVLHKEIKRRAGRKSEFLVLSRKLYMHSVFSKVILLEWKNGIAYRVGVMSFAVEWKRWHVVAEANPRRRRIVLG